MSKRKPAPPMRSLRPMAELLESRQLLSLNTKDVPKGLPTEAASAVVRGTDPDGAQWTLRLYGPGTLNVVGTNGDVFTRSTGEPDGIDQYHHRGRIHHDRDPPGRDGQTHVHGQRRASSSRTSSSRRPASWARSTRARSAISGLYKTASWPSTCPISIMAHTETTKPSIASQIHTSAMSAGEIYIPQGVLTLRFGGVNVNYTPAGGTPLNTTGQNNEFQISLGLPVVVGNQHHREHGEQRRRSGHHLGLRHPTRIMPRSWSLAGSTSSRPTRSTETRRPGLYPHNSSTRRPAPGARRAVRTSSRRAAPPPGKSVTSGSAAARPISPRS